jgi:phosphate/sulfate permease
VLTVGTAFGGWRIVRTVDLRIYRIRPIDGLASSAAGAGIILGASLVGGLVSTTQVVASSVVGVGAGPPLAPRALAIVRPHGACVAHYDARDRRACGGGARRVEWLL